MENTNNEIERREFRRRRRMRSQIIVYTIAALAVILVAVLIILGVRSLAGKKQVQESVQQSQQVVLEEIASSEEEIVPPTPEAQLPPPKTPEQMLDEFIDEIVAQMPLEDRVAGLFFVTPEAITGVSAAVKAGDGTKDALNTYAVGGVAYFAKNIKNEEQFKEMISNTVLYSKYPLFIGIDEEGGEVSRLSAAGLVEKTDSAQVIGQSGDPNKAYEAGVKIGTYLADYGVNVNFAPVADIASVENSVMTKRSYGSDPEQVSQYVVGMVKGMEEQGVTACLKHFPGIGGTTEDSHNGLATLTTSAEDFRNKEFAVFKAGIDAGADIIMVGHEDAPALTDNDNTPASLSKIIVTDILRGELGHKGVIITDAMNMKAISEYYGSGEAAIMAFKAGCDMVLMPENFEEAYNAVLKAIADGTISEQRINDSLKRVYRIKYEGKFEE